MSATDVRFCVVEEELRNKEVLPSALATYRIKAIPFHPADCGHVPTDLST